MKRHPLVLVPLSGSPRTRRQVARQALEEAWRLGAGGGGSDCVLVLHRSRPGYLEDKDLPNGARLVDPEELLDRSQIEQVVRKVHDWTESLVASERSRFFPVWKDVHMGSLNLVEVRRTLVDAYLIVEATRSVLGPTTGRGVPVSVVAPYPELARLIEGSLENADVRSWSPAWMGRFSRRLKEALSRVRARVGRAEFWSGDPGQWTEQVGDGPIVFWVESVPMIQMFDSVLDQLQDDPALPPVLQVEWLDPEGEVDELSPGRWRVRIGSPQSRRRMAAPSRYRSHWPRAWKEPLPGGGGGEQTEGDEEYLRLLVESLYRHEFDRQAEYVDFASRVLDSLGPRLLVVGNDRFWVGQAAVELARARGIPTLAVQDGVMVDTTPWTSAWADHVAVNGAYLGRLLEDHGLPRSRWTVTGQPRYDEMLKMDRESVRRRLRERLDVGQDAPLVLFTTQSRLTEEYVRSVVSSLLALENVQLALRPHPSESDTVHRAMVEQHPGRVFLARDQGILDLIVSSDLVVMESSTVALEAAALGVPVIGAAFGGGLIAPHMRVATDFHAQSAGELRGLAGQVLAREPEAESGGGRRKALEDFLGPLDGKASERVAHLIRRMLSEETGPAETSSSGVESRV